MANRLVSVDENLHLPPAVLDQLTADVRTEFNTSLNNAQTAATNAGNSATAAAGSATAAAASATAAQNAANSILIPTDEIVDERIDAAGVLKNGEFVYDVTKYGAVGDGSTPNAVAVQAAVDAALANGGGVVYFPAGDYYMESYVIVGSNLTLRGAGVNATTLNKTGISGAHLSACFFWAQSGTNTGYGAGGRNITIEDMRFAGSFAQGRTGLIIQLHHTDGFTMRNCVADKIQGGGHAVDALGSRNILIEDCTFLGVDGSRVYTECIQIDYSAARGFSMPDENAGCDGLPTSDVTVNRCKFLPATEGATTYYAPNPIGTHTGVQSTRSKNIRFTNNYVQDWQGDNTSAYNGAIHFAVGIENLEISGNTFVATLPTTGYAINLYRGAFLSPLGTVTNPSPPAAPESATPLPPRYVRIIGNTFLDKSTSGSGFSMLSLLGNSSEAYYAQHIVIADNVMDGGLRFAYLQQVKNAAVTGNVFTYGPTTANTGTASGTGVRLATCQDVTIANNQLTGRDPMYVATSARVAVTGNSLTPVAVAGNTTYGIYYTGAGNSVGTITGNTVYNPSATPVTRGIYASNGSSNAIILGNTVVGAFTNAGVTQSGSTNVVVPSGTNATA
jgi:hypothetical protein